MANPKLPRRKKSPGERAMLEARARAEHDRLQEQMAVLAAELSQTRDSVRLLPEPQRPQCTAYGRDR